MFIYGALVDNQTDEARADIDAILCGETPPSVVAAETQRQAAIWDLALQGQVG